MKTLNNAVWLVAVSVLAACCADDPDAVITIRKREFACTKSHNSTYFVPVMMGKVTTLQARTTTYCDIYERISR